jgi:hypothetical protein
MKRKSRKHIDAIYILEKHAKQNKQNNIEKRKKERERELKNYALVF